MADRESQDKDTGKLRREAHKRAKLSKEARQEREVIKGEERESSNRHPDGILAHLSMNPVWFLTAVAAMVAVMICQSPVSGRWRSWLSRSSSG